MSVLLDGGQKVTPIVTSQVTGIVTLQRILRLFRLYRQPVDFNDLKPFVFSLSVLEVGFLVEGFRTVRMTGLQVVTDIS